MIGSVIFNMMVSPHRDKQTSLVLSVLSGSAGGGEGGGAPPQPLMQTLHLPMLSLCCQPSVSVVEELLELEVVFPTLVSQKL